MYFSMLCASTIVLACYLGSVPIKVNGADIAATNEAISRFMADAKHTVETAGEHREKDLEAFLKTGKMPGVPSLPKKDTANKVKVDKLKDIPTEVLMKQFLDGGSHIKQHLNATGRGRGPDKVSSPAMASTQLPVPSKSPKGEKKKKKKGKSKSFTKSPKAEKDANKKEKGKKGQHSDYPSSSPTPTLPGQGDVSLPPNYENGNAPNNSYVEHDEVSNDTGNNGDGHQDDGRSTDGSPDSGVESDTASPSKTSSITKIVSPLAAFAGLILIAGVWISRRRTLGTELDQDENLMKHTREGFDVETATVSGSTYRTGAFTEDDGTLEESVDVHEENRKSKVSQIHAKEMVQVLHELEDVSINDDVASTTSVSSRSHSPTNSCDGSFIEAARAAMSAEVFQPDKTKVYDSSVKPEWATRTNTAASVDLLNKEFDESLDSTSIRATSYKKFISSSFSPNPCYTEQIEPSEDGASLLNTCDLRGTDEISNDDKTDIPAWMKTQLRPVATNSSIPKSEIFNDQTASVDTEPEWMKKFKQMGLEKKE